MDARQDLAARYVPLDDMSTGVSGSENIPVGIVVVRWPERKRRHGEPENRFGIKFALKCSGLCLVDSDRVV